MKSVGEVLKKARLEKKLSLEEVEKKTKIRAKFLQALEENEYQKLSSSTYIRGFIKNYSEFLDLPSEKILGLFRRQFDEKRNVNLLPKGLAAPLKESGFSFKGKQAIIIFFLLPLVLFFTYLYREYYSFVKTPSLVIYIPQEEMVVTDGILEVSGQTDPTTTLTLNGQKIIVGERGDFNQEITLTSGLNTLEFVAENKLGREKKVERIVQVSP